MNKGFGNWEAPPCWEKFPNNPVFFEGVPKLHTIRSSSKDMPKPRFGLWFCIEGKMKLSLKTQLKNYLNTSIGLQFRSSSLSDSFDHFCDLLFIVRLEPGIFIHTKISTKTQTFDRNHMSDRTSNVKCLIKFQY